MKEKTERGPTQVSIRKIQGNPGRGLLYKSHGHNNLVHPTLVNTSNTTVDKYETIVNLLKAMEVHAHLLYIDSCIFVRVLFAVFMAHQSARERNIDANNLVCL